MNNRKEFLEKFINLLNEYSIQVRVGGDFGYEGFCEFSFPDASRIVIDTQEMRDNNNTLNYLLEYEKEH